ncbi:MAG TPA: DUF4150 domain-containing protein [Nitrosomonas sp.]|nr:DUF4150 domain-containing protein [Nitrosomonas sp.]HQX12830.1 DUF4150 domain-containing protein [Nitrosomonas sp.]HRB20905.1 DUF4150 domain-containing protein [Nitrosomonas sp.]HRB32814.1 DUF4150 domain-containing protein [Nitrosomonas sp.]HRB45441.1 DUF4150 domain-containing protein [Nitrosomonas sp.]
MANEVYANGMELACKAGSGKVIAAFPDVCFTPPENPATPPGVPLPYPNTGMASDTADGSKSVQISGKEIMLKNKSYFKTLSGNEAGCAAKKGVVSGKIKGKVYFVKWSMDVKVESENVDRHLDLTTNNHGSPTANEAAPWTFIDRMSLAIASGSCNDEIAAAKTACGDLKQKAKCPVEGKELAKARSDADFARKAGVSKEIKKELSEKIKKLERSLAGAIQKDPCQRAMRCFLTPFDSGQCCPGQTPDHLIEVKSFILPGQSRTTGKKRPGWGRYNSNSAPCLCVEGGASSISTHGVLSAKRKVAVKAIGKGKPIPLSTAASIGAKSASTTFKGCSEECIKGQLLKYHESVQDSNAEVYPPAHGMSDSTVSKKAVLDRALKLMS